MVRFIAQLLIVSLLTLNIAWAFDECALTDPAGASGLSAQADGQSPVDPANAGLDCDDWCHVWVNPIALWNAIVLDGYTPTTINDGSYTLSYLSLPIPPPFHPPIA